MSMAEKDLRANLLKSAGGGWRCAMLEAASTVMRRRIGRCAIRNGRDRAARDPRGQDQRGITLQSLIITSIVVFLAIAVGFTLFAINAGSSEDLEAAGQSDAGGPSCAPNEIYDLDYESKGLGGSQNVGGVESSEIGCKPHCETWEFMTAGPNDDGEYELTKDWLRITQDNVGGPTGNNGVFSSRTGCFAPCYWRYSGTKPTPYAYDVKSEDSSLHYYATNKAPDVGEVRLGVVYRRSAKNVNAWLRGNNPTYTDYGRASTSTDGKRIIITYNTQYYGAGAFAGQPLSSTQLKIGGPNRGGVATPNWRSLRADPGPSKRYAGDPDFPYARTWEDENWEVRADPESETCEIVDVFLNDQLVCTSARDSCAPA